MNRLAVWLAVLILSACGTADPSAPPRAIPTQAPDATRTPPPADTGWRVAGDGIETRELEVSHQSRRDRLFIARVDPDRVTFRVQYDPEQPRRVGEWFDAAHARLIVNGGFFDEDDRVLGLLISDGAAFGKSYVDVGGLFGVRAGRAQIRSLILEPYRPDEFFDQMVQSFPTLLVGEGGINTLIRDDGRRAPRSVVGIDRQGRVVFLVSPRSTFSLADLAAWLARSDLDLASALNLDGGTSSGMMVRTADGLWGSDSWVPVPAVIVVE
jgi:hypothetical protein